MVMIKLYPKMRSVFNFDFTDTIYQKFPTRMITSALIFDFHKMNSNLINLKINFKFV